MPPFPVSCSRYICFFTTSVHNKNEIGNPFRLRPGSQQASTPLSARAFFSAPPAADPSGCAFSAFEFSTVWPHLWGQIAVLIRRLNWRCSAKYGQERVAMHGGAAAGCPDLHGGRAWASAARSFYFVGSGDRFCLAGASPVPAAADRRTALLPGRLCREAPGSVTGRFSSSAERTGARNPPESPDPPRRSVRFSACRALLLLLSFIFLLPLSADDAGHQHQQHDAQHHIQHLWRVRSSDATARPLTPQKNGWAKKIRHRLVQKIRCSFKIDWPASAGVDWRCSAFNLEGSFHAGHQHPGALGYSGSVLRQPSPGPG